MPQTLTFTATTFAPVVLSRAAVIPEMRASKKTTLLVLCAIVLSCLFKYLPGLKEIPSGFVIIIVSVLVSALFAAFAPIPDEEGQDDEAEEREVSET